jgi:hypothetical protein
MRDLKMSSSMRPHPARRLGALCALLSLASCGPCNCNVPSFNAATPVSPVVVVAVPTSIPTVVPTTVPTTGPNGQPTTVPTTLPTTVPTTIPTTVPVASCNQGAGAIALGPALAPFVLLAGSTVTNTGLTVVTAATGASTAGVNDDLIGVSPGTAVGGFYPPGTDQDGPNAIYAAGFNANAGPPAAAQGALITAYNTLAGEAATAVFPNGQDLSLASVPGHATGTLPPGVYKTATAMGIMAGNLTLDGGGNPQSVFVFQAGTTLTTTLNGAASGNVILINGASACNIYWQVGSSATLGGMTFFGNVLSLTAVSLTSSTSFTGRALARNGAVTISSASTIINPGGI